MDHIAKGTLDLSELKYLVLDEADEMLKMGFAEDVETILAETPDDKQVALFSATMPAQIRRISQQYLTDPAEITVKTKTKTAANITQRYLMVSYPQKVDALTRILEVEDFEGMIIFVRTKSETETLAEKLRARGYAAAAISGDVAQAQRERTVNQLKSGKLDILVATDVAARGLDVDRITHVVNFDIPVDIESYVHRIGRTGRAGRKGDSISFVTPRERRLLSAIERHTKQPLTQMQLPTIEDVNETRLTRFDDAITAALEQQDRISAFRDVIAHYVRNHDVPAEDVSAALAVVAQGEDPLLLDPKSDELSARVGRDGASGARRDRDDRGDRPDREDRGPRRSQPMTAYRIEVGRRHRVEPRQIVGALANEGGLRRDDFGAIQIRPDFSIVELPTDMDAACSTGCPTPGSAASSSRSSRTVVVVAVAVGTTATTVARAVEAATTVTATTAAVGTVTTAGPVVAAGTTGTTTTAGRASRATEAPGPRRPLPPAAARPRCRPLPRRAYETRAERRVSRP